MRPALVLAAGLLLPSAALAEEEPRPRPWELDAGASYIIIGPAERQTGGLMPRVAARHRWEIGRAVDVSLGAQIGAFGFGDETRWLGILGGLSGSVGVRPARWLGLSLAVEADGGRIPVCNAWGLCLRHVGLFPAARLGATWYSDGVVAVGAIAAARWIETLAWSGPAFEAGAVGRLAF